MNGPEHVSLALGTFLAGLEVCKSPAGSMATLPHLRAGEEFKSANSAAESDDFRARAGPASILNRT